MPTGRRQQVLPLFSQCMLEIDAGKDGGQVREHAASEPVDATFVSQDGPQVRLLPVRRGAAPGDDRQCARLERPRRPWTYDSASEPNRRDMTFADATQADRHSRLTVGETGLVRVQYGARIAQCRAFNGVLRSEACPEHEQAGL